MALQEIENPMILERRTYKHPETVLVKPETVCACGCGKWAGDGLMMDGEYLYSDDCYVRLALSEGWIRRVG